MKKTNLVTFISLVLICLCSTALSAATIVVDPNEDNSPNYTTIQEAIDNSNDGDTIEVMPSTYYENINFKGMEIKVTSTNPDDMAIVYTTVINGGLSGDTVTFATSEDSASILTGITVENGSRGIYCDNSSPTIEKCVIRNSKSGDGIPGLNASPAIKNCIIRKNKGDGIYGCGGHITDCSVEENTGDGISNCDGIILRTNVIANGLNGLYKCNGIIDESSITGSGSHGLRECDGTVKNSAIQGNNDSGIFYADGTEVYNCVISGNSSYGIGYIYGLVTNCTIVGNESQGIVTTSSTSSSRILTISNNIIVNNDMYGINQVRSATQVNLLNNNIWGNTSGHYTGYLTTGETDIHVDPLFAANGSWAMAEFGLKAITTCNRKPADWKMATGSMTTQKQAHVLTQATRQATPSPKRLQPAESSTRVHTAERKQQVDQ